MPAFAQIYVADGATAQTISGTAAKMTGFTTSLAISNGGDTSVVADATNDKITVKAGGVYKVDLSISGTNSAAGDVQANIRVASTEVANGACRANFATSNADNSMSVSCIVKPAADSDIEVYLEGGSTDFTPVFANLVVTRLDG